MRGDDLQLIPESAFQELKPRDLQIAKGLLSSKFLQVCIWLLNFPVLLLCKKLRDDMLVCFNIYLWVHVPVV